MVQSSKQELYLLNWEIAHLTQKLQSFSEMYSTVDLKTVEFLERMIKKTNSFLTNKQLIPVSEWDEGDKAIFEGYTFSRSINCKMCERSVKITKPGLLKHLAEHDELIPAKAPPKSDGKKLVETGKNNKPVPQNEKKKKKDVNNKPRLENEKPCVEKGCLPTIKEPLSNKMKKFLAKSPQDQLKLMSEQKQEQTDSPPVHVAIATDLESVLAKEFPNVKAHPYGSRVTGLGKDTSDVDLWLDLEGNEAKDITKETIKQKADVVQDLLKSSGKWSELKPILNARTPILRAWNQQYKLDCDMSFSNVMSMANTELIQYFFEIQPICSAVTRYVKEWAQYLNIEALNGYTVTLLTIFFFQVHNLLPSVNELQTNNSKDHQIRKISHWRFDFERKSLDQLKLRLIPETDFVLYLIGLFSYYGEAFQFETHMVCPFLGQAQKKNLCEPRNVPPKMERLRDYYASLDLDKAHPVNDLLQHTKPLVVQDPFELNHNVAKGLLPINVSKLRKMCADTGALLNGASKQEE